jgi:flagellar biosynthesis protein FliP
MKRSKLATVLLLAIAAAMVAPPAATQEAGGGTATDGATGAPGAAGGAALGEAVPTGEEALQVPFIDLNIREPQNGQEVALSVQLLLILAVLSLAPSIIILTTSFLRIAIVFDFVKRALSLQQVPPTQVLMGVALFMTMFIMWPTIEEIYDDAFQPFRDGEIGIEEAYGETIGPLRVFMYRQMREDPESVRLFMRMGGLDRPQNLADVPTRVLLPAFVLHELTVAFKIGILLFIPFIIIDMVVASTLMSMGMIMLPPIMISLPFKLILFVLVDGWNLITQQLVASFGGF